MTNKYPNILMLILIVICLLIGWVARSVIGDTGMNKSMAWGYEEKSNVWNRIRVDEQGHVLCHKE